jgi:multidrug resistance efflux pump
VNVDIGDKVKKGDVLAKIVVPEMEQKLQTMKALITWAESEVKNAKTAVDGAEAEIKVAESKTSEAKANIERADATRARWLAAVDRSRRLSQARSGGRGSPRRISASSPKNRKVAARRMRVIVDLGATAAMSTTASASSD